ncbi:MAG TPA: ATPase, T2SS/T4P/T4SS family [Phycisphaerae bacterium]|nr:ATPase, T2SS/T4P/T4SS family [Phycisphaerae bacterium]
MTQRSDSPGKQVVRAARTRTTAPAEPAAPSIAVGTGTHVAFEAALEFFLAPLLPFLRDPEVTEVMVNGPEKIYVERRGRVELTRARFDSESDVQAAANNIAQFVGQTLTQERPLLDGRLPDGSRVCIVLSHAGGLAASGTHINIRRFGRATGTPEFLLEKGALTPMALEFLSLCVKARQNILVAGGAGSGKTTLVNVLTGAFDEQERVVVIEDTRELQVQRPHVVQMEARPADAYGRGQITVRELFVTALRMRPDRLVVGEVRRGEALDMIQAMTSGHHGSLTTLHASSPLDACHRLETMALMADVGIPLFALRRQVASAIDVIVQTARLATGRRLVTSIAEVDFDDATQNYIITDIFRITGAGDDAAAQWTGQPSHTLGHLRHEGLDQWIQHTRHMLDAAD